MFSLHIDTAETWRGGQNQVLLTVLGLRALGHRTMLVAHPAGELRQRAKEGLELIPLAPKTEMDLSAAWRLSRLLKQLQPDIVHAHDPHGVAMAALALSMSTQLRPSRRCRRAARRLPPEGRTRCRAGSTARSTASSALRSDPRDLIADGVPAGARVTSTKGSIWSRRAAPPAELHADLWLPHERHSSATWRRWCRTRASGT